MVSTLALGADILVELRNFEPKVTLAMQATPQGDNPLHFVLKLIQAQEAHPRTSDKRPCSLNQIRVGTPN